jgi:tryptophan-rich sensory protein
VTATARWIGLAAFILVVPYLARFSFAAVLNFTISRLNTE